MWGGCEGEGVVSVQAIYRIKRPWRVSNRVSARRSAARPGPADLPRVAFVLQAHPADFDQSFTPSLRSMTRGEDMHPISVVIAGVCPL